MSCRVPNGVCIYIFEKDDEAIVAMGSNMHAWWYQTGENTPAVVCKLLVFDE